LAPYRKILLKGIFVVGFISILFIACNKENSRTFERNDLATFDIGRTEGELDIFNLRGKRSQHPVELAMRDGMFYISNGNGEKIVHYNSYGDLLFMIYNEDTNPPPLTLKPKTEGIEETRWANPWPLVQPAQIAVNSRKHIFVVDKLSDERHGYDKAEKAILDSIVLHFDDEGNFVEYLGQEGRGGTPFAMIENIAVTEDNALCVISRLPKGRIVYTYDIEGNQVSVIKFNDDKLPVPNGVDGILVSLDSIAVSPDQAKIYLKIDYYHEIFDAAINTVAGMEGDSCYIWIVNLQDGSYIGSIEIPFYTETYSEAGKRVNEHLFYSMFGAMRDNKLFFYTPSDEGFSVLIIDSANPNKQRRGVIKVNPAELQLFSFNLSEEGVLSALLADEYQVKLVWWRTDRLAESM
jgi:hypothetical protein